MNDVAYRILSRIALGLTALFVLFSVYDCSFRERAPGDLPHLEGDTLFEDGAYERALKKYQQALTENPHHIHALRGKARALMQLGQMNAALTSFDAAIEREPAFGASYANRGIARDRIGQHQQALADYDKALQLDPQLAEGPHWMTRFLRLQSDKPPGIAERAAYLRKELAKPFAQRLLRVPEQDNSQRPFKQ